MHEVEVFHYFRNLRDVIVSPASLYFPCAKIENSAKGRENISLGELGGILRNSGMSVVRCSS